MAPVHFVRLMPAAIQATDLPALTRAPEVPRVAAARFQEQLERANATAPTSSTSSVVRPTRTQISGSQAGDAIARAYRELTGETPTPATLAILTSHWSLETGQGTKMYNFNFAGIKGRGPEGLTAVLGTREGWGATETHIRDGFRAYTSADQGARDYVSLLQRKYAPALEAARSEDPTEFAIRLGEGGYFTGHPGRYAEGITRLANRAMAHGLDAVGKSSGATTMSVEELTPYFPSPGAFAASRTPSVFAGSHEPARRLPFEPLHPWDMAQLVDEVTRAALQIARERDLERRENPPVESVHGNG